MNARPKIAVMIDWYLPGTHAGGPVRSVFSLVELLREDFDFYVITSNTDLGSETPYSDIAPDRLFLKNGVHYYYFSRAQLTGSSMQKLLSEIVPDLVYVNSFWSYPFSIMLVRLKAAGSLKPPLLLAPRGMLGKGAMGLKHFKNRVYLTIGRIAGWYRHVSFHATQANEEHDIRNEFPRAMVFIAPNVNALRPSMVLKTKPPGTLRLFFLSRISKVKNLKFALEVLGKTNPAHQITYDIFGNIEDADYWKECESVVRALPSHVRVTYMRELPFGQIQPALESYHALWLPTLNENYGHAIVESLLCGCPVIISDQTPWNDVNEHGCGFALPLNSHQDFVRVIDKCAAQNQEDYRQMSEKSIGYISQKIDLRAIADKYKNMFYGCIKNQPGQLR